MAIISIFGLKKHNVFLNQTLVNYVWAFNVENDDLGVLLEKAKEKIIALRRNYKEYKVIIKSRRVGIECNDYFYLDDKLNLINK